MSKKKENISTIKPNAQRHQKNAAERDTVKVAMGKKLDYKEVLARRADPAISTAMKRMTLKTRRKTAAQKAQWKADLMDAADILSVRDNPRGKGPYTWLDMYRAFQEARNEGEVDNDVKFQDWIHAIVLDPPSETFLTRLAGNGARYRQGVTADQRVATSNTGPDFRSNRLQRLEAGLGQGLMDVGEVLYPSTTRYSKIYSHTDPFNQYYAPFQEGYDDTGDPDNIPNEIRPMAPVSFSKNFNSVQSHLRGHTNIAEFSYAGVNKKAFCTWLCPEDYLSAIPEDSVDSACAVTSTTYEIPLITDASGNTFAYINMHGIAQTAAVTDQQFFAIGNPAALAVYNPTTGAYTTGGGALPNLNLKVAGPFGAAGSPIRDYKLLGARLLFLPIQSALNNQGTITVAQFKSSINASFLTGPPVTPFTAILNNTYFQESNMPVAQEHIWMPTDSADTDFGNPINQPYSGLAPFSDIFYAVIQGAAASSTVMKVVLTLNIAYHVQDTSKLYIREEVPHGGQATRALINSAIKILPDIEHSNQQTRKMIAKDISASSGDYNECARLLISHAK